MKWLETLAEKIALWVLRRARKSSAVSARQFEQWKRDYKEDFGKDFKQ
jgi:hypothetical protein